MWAGFVRMFARLAEAERSKSRPAGEASLVPEAFLTLTIDYGRWQTISGALMRGSVEVLDRRTCVPTEPAMC
jgi:hypothetical protein